MKFWEWEGDVTTWPYLGLLGLGLYQMWRDFNKINDHNIATDSTPKSTSSAKLVPIDFSGAREISVCGR